VVSIEIEVEVEVDQYRCFFLTEICQILVSRAVNVRRSAVIVCGREMRGERERERREREGREG
jgi:hypothetical protein